MNDLEGEIESPYEETGEDKPEDFSLNTYWVNYDHRTKVGRFFRQTKPRILWILGLCDHLDYLRDYRPWV